MAAGKADICGADLRRLGLAPGPLYGIILKAALVAKLDGEAPNAQSQLGLARALLKSAAESGGKSCVRPMSKQSMLAP